MEKHLFVDEVSFCDHFPPQTVKFDQLFADGGRIMFFVPLLPYLFCCDGLIFNGAGVGVIVQFVKVKNAVPPAVDTDHKTVDTGFLGLALAYVVTALIGVIPGFKGILPGALIVVISAFPMALLGIIPQAIVADVAEEDAIVTGEKREGMFFAARTFAMKMGQSVAMLVFTSLAVLGTTQDLKSNDLTASPIGLRIVAIVAICFCVLGAVILAAYDEKKVMKTIEGNANK